jgi:hypothetical protein
MATTRATTVTARPVRLIGILLVVAGLVLVAAGAVTWGAVRNQLVAEHITIPDDAMAFQGNRVDGPLDAYVQADIINHHALEASGGATYAELDRDDPVRDTVMDASFLRASLFSSVIAFGVAALAAGIGALQLLLGWALLRLSPRPVAVAVREPEPAAAAAADRA